MLCNFVISNGRHGQFLPTSPSLVSTVLTTMLLFRWASETDFVSRLVSGEEGKNTLVIVKEQLLLIVI